MSTFRMVGYRFRLDNGDEATAEWATYAEGVPLEWPVLTNLRIRAELQNSNAASGVNPSFKLRARRTYFSTTTWEDVTSGATWVKPAASPNVADDAATTNQLTRGTGTFVAGKFDEVDGAVTIGQVAANGHTEIEFCVQLQAAAGPGVILEFHVIPTNESWTSENSVFATLLVRELAPGPIPDPRSSFILADRAGNDLEDISDAITKWTWQFRLRRPASLKLTVPSDHDKIWTPHTDGRPLMAEMRRVKWWRNAGTGSPVLRGHAYVWALSDKGEGDTVQTEALCYGPDIMLANRVLRDTTGAAKRAFSSKFTPPDGYVNTLIDSSNRISGPDETHTGIDAAFSSEPRFEPSLPIPDYITFEYKKVGEILMELTERYGFDYYLLPIESGEHMAEIHYWSRLGVFRPNLAFSYGVANSNCSRMERASDVSRMATDYRAYGGGSFRQESAASDLSEDDIYGVHEDQGIFETVTEQTYLDAISNTALALRRRPKEIVSWQPLPGAIEPFVDLDLGDTFYVHGGSRLRGGFSGIQRCYGFDIEGDAQGGEKITAVYTSPEG